MNFMKIFNLLLMFIILPLTLMAQSSSLEGEWSPDSQCWLGEIKIKQSGENEYKIRMDARDGVKVFTATLDNGTLYGKFEDESPEYGVYWVENGKILVGKGGYKYGTDGEVSGWLGDNAGYRKTNSRSKCATVEKSYCRLRFVISGESMTAYVNFRAEYLKDGEPMFYQESGWGPGFQYTKW